MFRPPLVVFVGDHEDGYDSGAVDLDLGDMGLDGRFSLTGGAVVQHVGEAAPEAFDGLRAGRVWQVVDELAEFVAAGFELVELDRQVVDAMAAGAPVVLISSARGSVSART